MKMDVRFEKKKAFRVTGVVVHTTTENNACMKDVPALWQDVMGSGKGGKIMALMNEELTGIIGISVYNTDPEDAKKFDYYIACATDQPAAEGMAEYTVPAATWAVFPCKGSEVGEVEIQIVREWQPNSGYELLNTGYETGEIKAKAPDLEVHMDQENAQVWVAVCKNRGRMVV